MTIHYALYNPVHFMYRVKQEQAVPVQIQTIIRQNKTVHPLLVKCLWI